jgi:hypothetical protein
MYELRVRLTFIEEILGSANANPDIHGEFIASKAPDAPSRQEEIEALGVEEVEKKEMTVFPRLEDGRPFLWDYQMRGMFKNAAKAMNYVGGDHKLPAYKSKIDNLVFIKERKIPYELPEGKGIGNCQRPLRASTAQGERIALANSETIPEGTEVEFTIKLFDDKLLKHVIEWLDYGEWNGLGQWHNSGKGRFTWKEIERVKK